ncbi:elastase-1-like [Mytilus californianus]|uniref:elastase-1-like n=1 Tax=Mytilus californianus TaxID=6549 RepID=UPI00224870D6|nr:elastase-1-like [Mytilus californianus]
MKTFLFICLLPAVFADPQTTFLSRIVNGQDAEPNEFPWQVSLQYRSDTTQEYSHICGAVVLDANRILTAAHCVEHDPTISNYEIVVGGHSLTEQNGNEQRRKLSDLKIHASYSNSGGYNNDIAVLILSSSLTLITDIVERATLPLSAQTFTGKNCYISGWGRTVANGPLPDILQKAATSVITHSDCRTRLGFTGILYLSAQAHICIYSGSNSACNGDSGGPLVCDVSTTNTENWQLAGVTSWGLTDCPVGSPSVYVRISSYIDWISMQ